MRLKEPIKQISPEIVEEMDMIIHDWRNLRLMLNVFIINSDNGDYSDELTWEYSRKYWEKKFPYLDKHVENMCNLLYGK